MTDLPEPHTPSVRPKPVEPERPDDHVLGPQQASNTIIEYGDYECPHTRAAHASLETLLRDNPDTKLIFRHFPLRHLHADAETLSRLLEAAHRLGQFWPLHQRVVAHRSGLDKAALQQALDELGLDLKQLTTFSEQPSVIERIERDVNSGRACGVHSTPTFFFNGRLHDGHHDTATLQRCLKEAKTTSPGS